MGHVVRMQSRDQFQAALDVLDCLPGTWHCRGTPESPILLVTDTHYQALVKAGIVHLNGEQEKTHGKKAAAKKVKS